MGKDIELRRDEIKVSAFGEVGRNLGVETGQVYMVSLLKQLTMTGEILWSLLSVMQASCF